MPLRHCDGQRAIHGRANELHTGLKTDELRTKYGRTTVRGESRKLDFGLLEAVDSEIAEPSKNHRRTEPLPARNAGDECALFRMQLRGGTVVGITEGVHDIEEPTHQTRECFTIGR